MEISRKKSKTETDSGTTITTSYGYDERGNLTTVTDSEGNLTTYTYDAANRNTAVTYEDATSITMTYDKNNNLATRTDAMGTVITNTYDDMNRLITRSIATGTGVGGVTSESYTYDALGRFLTGADSQSGALAFSYDFLSRLTSESQYISGSSTKTTSYAYDSGSNLTSITYPDSRVQTFSYDTLNRNTEIIYSGSTIATYTYTGILLANIVYGNSTSKTLTYDELYRPESLTTPGGDYDYSYSDVGDITGDGERNYAYDALRRLKTVSLVSTGSAPKTESYTYDRAANRTSSIANGTSTSYTTNELNQYTATSGGDTKSYTYDNNGNLKSDGTKLYTYDYQNRLVEVKRSSDNTTIASYTYDLLGRRTKKVDSSRSTNASETTIYTYSNENTIAEEKTIRSGTSSIVLNKVYINGLGTDNLLAYDTDERTISDYNLGKLNFCDSRVFPYESEFIGYSYTGITTDCSNLLVTSSGTSHNRYYVHTNHHGSVVALTSSTGVIVQQYAYDAFGVPYVKSGTGVNTVYTLISSYTGSLHENSRLYTSREYDKEVLLYFNRARYYSPSTGKFISRDPIGQNDQVNLYTYVANSPMMYVDRIGLAKALILVGYDWNGGSSINKMMKLQYKKYIEAGYKAENISLHRVGSINEINVYADSKFGYKDIALIAHGNKDLISLVYGPAMANQRIDSNTVQNLGIMGDKNTTLTLDSCLTGAGENPIAEKISKQTQVTVKAPISLILAGDTNLFSKEQNEVMNGGYLYTEKLSKDWWFQTFQSWGKREKAHFNTFYPNN